jgi:hypothetical protein
VRASARPSIRSRTRFGVGEHLDRVAEPVQLTGGHHVGHMLAMGDDSHGVAVFGAAHHFGPGRGFLGVDAGHWLAHVSQDTAVRLWSGPGVTAGLVGLTERHLRRILTVYLHHFNSARTHRTLTQHTGPSRNRASTSDQSGRLPGAP